MAGEAGLAGRQPVCPSQPRGPASCPQRPGSSVGLRAGGKEGAPIPPCSSCKASFVLRHGGSRQPFSRVHDGRRPGVRRSARARSWLSRGKAEPRSAAAASGPAGACASLPSPDLLNPSFRVGQVGRGSWALAFGSRWLGGHPAACPAPAAFARPSWGGLAGRSVVCGLRLSLSFAG